MQRRSLLLCSLGLLSGFLCSAVAQERAKEERTPSTANLPGPADSANSKPTHDGSPAAAGSKGPSDDRIARLEGEKRFRTNCGRCHQPPHKFPPRVMAAAIRHMRVRAMITDEDMRYILSYMTQ